LIKFLKDAQINNIKFDEQFNQKITYAILQQLIVQPQNQKFW